MSTAEQPQVSAPTPIRKAEAAEEARAKGGTRRVLILAAVAMAAIGGFLVYRGLNADRQTTDDAIVDASLAPVAVRVAGAVASVKVSDNQRVKKGDVLLELDAAELTARLQQAQGELDAAKAQALAADAQMQVAEAGARGGLSVSRAQVVTSKAQVSSSSAQIASAEAQLARAESEVKRSAADLERNRQLLAQNAVSKERLEAVEAADESARAALAAARAMLTAAQDGRRVAESRVVEASGALDANAPIEAKIAAAHAAAEFAKARVVTAAATLELARLAVTYATVIAPTDGVISKLSIREGQLLSAGQPVASIVPEQTYVVANFKETQVGAMKAGQPVEVEVDAFPGRHFSGVVASLAGGTGSRFSLLPPDNAAGNFVKVVQRVPVRIEWAGLPAGLSMRAGMSATATVLTREVTR